MRNSTVNNSYPIYASRFESCLTQLHLGGTLGLHTHVIILFTIMMLEEENVLGEKCSEVGNA